MHLTCVSIFVRLCDIIAEYYIVTGRFEGLRILWNLRICPTMSENARRNAILTTWQTKWSFLACPELYCYLFRTQLTYWNQIQIFRVFWVSNSLVHILPSVICSYVEATISGLGSFPLPLGTICGKRNHLRGCKIYCNEWSLVALGISGDNCCTGYISPLIHSC